MGEGARRAGEGYYVRNYLCQYLKDFKNFGEYFYARRYLHKFSKNFKIFQNMCCQCFSHFHHPSANILRQLNVGWAFSPTKISAFTLAEVLNFKLSEKCNSNPIKESVYNNKSGIYDGSIRLRRYVRLGLRRF